MSTTLPDLARAIGLRPDASEDSVYAAAIKLIEAHNRLVEREASRGTGLHPLLVALLDTRRRYLKDPREETYAPYSAAVRAFDAADEPRFSDGPRFADAPGNTVKVRIAVAVRVGGRASIWQPDEDDTPATLAKFAPAGSRVSIVTANVPLPVPAAEVVGEVTT